MEILYLLFVLLPGLFLYSKLRDSELTASGDEPEYVVLIKGVYGSLLYIIAGLVFVRCSFPGIGMKDSIYRIMTNPLYLAFYFLSIPAYSWIAKKAIQKYKEEWSGKLSLFFSSRMKKKAYKDERDNLWVEIGCLLREHGVLYGEIYKDGNLLSSGQISFISRATAGHIGFFNKKMYDAAFNRYNDAKEKLKCLGHFVDTKNNFVIDVYNSNTLISFLEALEEERREQSECQEV